MTKDNTENNESKTPNWPWLKNQAGIENKRTENESMAKSDTKNSEQEKKVTNPGGDRGITYATWAIFIATFFYAIFALLQWRTIERQLTIGERAWVTPRIQHVSATQGSWKEGRLR